MEGVLWQGLFLFNIAEVARGDVEGSRARRTVATCLLRARVFWRGVCPRGIFLDFLTPPPPSQRLLSRRRRPHSLSQPLDPRKHVDTSHVFPGWAAHRVRLGLGRQRPRWAAGAPLHPGGARCPDCLQTRVTFSLLSGFLPLKPWISPGLPLGPSCLRSPRARHLLPGRPGWSLPPQDAPTACSLGGWAAGVPRIFLANVLA